MVGKFSLQGARHLIWDQIIIEADKFRPYLDLIEYQENAMKEAKKKVLTVWGEIQKRPMETMENAIAFLISLSNNFTDRYGIQNRIVVVYGARKVIAKHRMLETVQAKIDVIEHKFKEVIRLFKPLVDKGIIFF